MVVSAQVKPLSTHTRIAMVMRAFSTSGGLELYAHKLVEGLLQCGYKVTVLCQRNESNFSHPQLRVATFSVEEGASKSQRITNLLTAATAAVKSEGPFDIVHSQHCPVLGANVVTFHNHTTGRLSTVGFTWERLLNEFKRTTLPGYKARHQYDELLCRHATCLIFPAHVMQQDFYSTFSFLPASNKPYVVAHPGADLAEDSPGSEHVQHRSSLNPAANKDCFNFLFVGRGFRKKGLDVLLEACSLLKQRQRSIKLDIAGLNEKPVDRLRLQIMGLTGTVRYLGFCKNMDEVYRQSQVLVLPSRVEPFGMAPVQAMQRGLVPIVSRVSGVAEVLSHESDALLLNNHLSARELADLMERLIDDSALRNKLADNAAKTATGVCWQATVEQTLHAYRIVLSGTERTHTTSGTGSQVH